MTLSTWHFAPARSSQKDKFGICVMCWTMNETNLARSLARVAAIYMKDIVAWAL